jgi:hypothetical protein
MAFVELAIMNAATPIVHFINGIVFIAASGLLTHRSMFSHSYYAGEGD